MAVKCHPESEWLSHRPLIEHMYSVERMTMPQVRDQLCAIGFVVNTRMVKTRLLKWNLHKKLQYADICTALDLLGSDKSLWPCENPRFRIRGRVIDFTEILRYFRRKGVRDPIHWSQTAHRDKFQRSSHVELLPDSEHIGNDFQTPSPNMSGKITPLTSDEDSNWATNTDHNLWLPTMSFEHLSPTAATEPLGTTLMMQMRDTEDNVLINRALWQFRSYCLSYIALDHQSLHVEPEIHHLTAHGKFQDRLSESLLLFSRRSWEPAFSHLQAAFALLKPMLENIHPMAVALYLATLCNLLATRASIVVNLLLQHTSEMAKALRSVPMAITELFNILQTLGEQIQLPLLCLRAASDVFEEIGTANWKSLYIEERHCDGLHHAQVFGEGASRRAKLLVEQEAFYGPSRRNVLWTSANVADDHLIHGRLDEAEAQFARVLHLSSSLSDFHQAKTSFAALEGLAKTYKAKSVQSTPNRLRGMDAIREDRFANQNLVHALYYAEKAVEIASTWFGSSGRRFDRICGLKREIEADAFISSHV